MSIGLSKTEIIGYVGRDAVLRKTKKGTPVCNFTVAVNHRSQDGQEWTQWFDVTIWQEFAERVAKWIKSGKQIWAEGYISPRSWVDDNGETQLRLELTVPGPKYFRLLRPQDKNEEEANNYQAEAMPF